MPVDAGVGDERGADRLARPGDHVEHARRDAGLVQGGDGHEAGEHALLGRLAAPTVLPATSAAPSGPADERHREVERARSRPTRRTAA